MTPSSQRVALRYKEAKTLTLYRGVVVDAPSAKAASMMRKAAVILSQGEWSDGEWRTYKQSPLSEGELERLCIEAIDRNDVGHSWSTNMFSAEKFGKGDYHLDRVPTSRGKTIGLVLTAEVDGSMGYDPVEAGEEFWMMTVGENEVRLKPGTKVKITGLGIYVPKKGRGSWYTVVLRKSYPATVR